MTTTYPPTNVFTTRRRATDPKKSLGQVAYEFMLERTIMGYGLDGNEELGSNRWDSQTPTIQKDWEDTAAVVIEEFKMQVVSL